MGVSIVLLGGVWGIEWLKSRFEHGVPTLAAASIATGELAMFAYFVGALVRAFKWAFSEVDEALSTIKNTNLFKDAKSAFTRLAPLLIEAIPSPRELLRASRFVILFLVLGTGALVLFGTLSLFPVFESSNSNFNSNKRANKNTNASNSLNSNQNINGRPGNTNFSFNANNANASANANTHIYPSPTPAASLATAPAVWRDEDRGFLSMILSVLLSIFDHSGVVAIIASVLVALTIFTFLSVQIVRAYAQH